MKCPQCAAWSEVKQTRGNRRRRLCANGHRFSTVEVHVVHIPSRDRAIADAVVLRGMRIAEAAKEFGLKSDSYVSRCVKRHYPSYNGRSPGQVARYRRQSKDGGSATSRGPTDPRATKP